MIFIQVDVFKKQISEYHSKLETETKRADKLEFETKKLLEQLEAVKVSACSCQLKSHLFTTSAAESEVVIEIDLSR
jgi:hypothetical protein